MVLSALRQRQRNENLVAWLQAVPESALFLSVITLGEVERGIAAVASRDPTFAQRLVVWLDEVLRRFAVHPSTGELEGVGLKRFPELVPRERGRHRLF